MKGSVAQTIMAVPVGHDVLPARPWRELATQYLSLIITPSAIEGLKSKLDRAKQKENESLSAWKARLVTLYNYAHRDFFYHTGITAATYPPVRDHFINGLSNMSLMADLRKCAPANLDVALAHAESLYGAMRAQSKMWGGGRGRGNKYQVSQMGAGDEKKGDDKPKEKEERSCHYCGKQGHLVRDCWAKEKDNGNPSTDRGRGRGRGGGGRGRGGQNRYNPTSTRGRGANRGGRSTGWNTSKRTISEVHAEEQPQEDVEWTEGSETQEQEESEN